MPTSDIIITKIVSSTFFTNNFQFSADFIVLVGVIYTKRKLFYKNFFYNKFGPRLLVKNF